MDKVESEMRKLRLELKQKKEMCSTTCKEALTAKQEARELEQWKLEEQQRLEEALLAEKAALALAEEEKAKSMAAIEDAEAAQRLAELEAQKRKRAEKKALRDAEEKQKALDVLANSNVKYSKYTIEHIQAATEKFSESLKINDIVLTRRISPSVAGTFCYIDPEFQQKGMHDPHLSVSQLSRWIEVSKRCASRLFFWVERCLKSNSCDETWVWDCCHAPLIIGDTAGMYGTMLDEEGRGRFEVSLYGFLVGRRGQKD